MLCWGGTFSGQSLGEKKRPGRGWGPVQALAPCFQRTAQHPQGPRAAFARSEDQDSLQRPSTLLQNQAKSASPGLKAWAGVDPGTL